MSRKVMDNAQLEAMRDIADDVDESDFVPYACLFDDTTLLTKNGELLQIIKITGFTYEAIDHDDTDLRSVIRQAVEKSIGSNEYALWFTTIRRKQNLSPGGDFSDPFSAQLHEAWTQRNGWDRKYINELYVSIVREGEAANIADAKSFFHGLVPKRDRVSRNAYIDRIGQELNATVEKLLGQLEAFGARRLTTVKREDGRYYGEHLEFLEKLINLEERPMPLSEIGLADYLTSGEISFAYNAMEVRSADGHRRFGAVLTVKEYKEASLHRIDEMLHLPCEFIVTQCVDFVNAQQAKQSYKDQHYFLSVSGEKELAESSELTQLLESHGSDDLSFGQQQTTLFVLADSVASLEKNVKTIRGSLSAMGIVSIREDIRFEDCYWATLPANFEFIARLGYINTRHIAGFANIQNYPAGNAAGCPWGAPTAVFYTAAGTPYFFNFHLGNVGHSMLVGPFGSGKSVLLNFLLAQARKYRPRLVYLDSHGHAGAFVRAIGGAYAEPCDGSSAALCPLSLPDSDQNRQFLALWVSTLVDPSAALAEGAMRAIRGAVDAEMTKTPEARSLSAMVSTIAGAAPELAAPLSRWIQQGEFAHLFDHAAETVAPQEGVLGLNLAPALEKPEMLVPLVSYLLHRITLTFDGAPAILVLDEAWQLLQNPLFAPRVGAWLDYIASKNGVVILTAEHIDQAAAAPFCAEIHQRCVTQIFMPDDEPSEAYETAFGLNEDETAYLEAMSVEYRHFMLKRRSETIIAELNLGGMDDILAVLSGNVKPPEAAEENAAPVEADTSRAMEYGDAS